MTKFTKSAIYSGWVRHRRFLPAKHEFTYKIYLTWVNLNEVDKLFNKGPLLSPSKWPSMVAFRRKNYLRSSKEDLLQACREKVKEDLSFDFDGEVCILTNLQYFGLCYNPVSFYYCYGKDENLKAIIAEINNTPWNQRHSYCIDMREKNYKDFDKDFHISPFMPMDINYHWAFGPAKEKLAVKMQNFHKEEQMFDVDMQLERQEWSTARVLKYSLLYPLIPLKVIWGIYYQALRLKMKKVPFYDHPKLSADEHKEPSHG